jgi:hypothetical protein
MEESACDEELSVESEFAATIKYIDLYIQQKTDLFLQHYLFEPFNLIAKKIVYLSILVTLLVAGTLVFVAGVILLISTEAPLWAALLITGVIIFLIGGIFAYVLFVQKIVLQTPTVTEMMNRGKT